MRSLLDDVRALEQMLDGGWIESGIRRIGAEQELFLVDSSYRPAPVGPKVLEILDDPGFTTELARFNLELNLVPRVLGGDCLARMEAELVEGMARASVAAADCDALVVTTGILPTLSQSDLGLDNMTPNPRYFQLNRVMSEMRGGQFHTYIKGLDELQTTHDNVMLEACNTSFQVHFQVGPKEFANLYNLAQLVTAPVLAVSVNSATLLQKRLWKETRVALFQQSLDTRSETHRARGGAGRVSFGTGWIHDSVLEIFREDIARFRVLISTQLNDELSTAVLARGVAPRLRALCLHNGTVYRWNRACYGVADGKAHLRIENRVMPAGPTIVDEVANSAFYFGLMTALGDEHDDVTKLMRFDDASANFVATARYGLKARVTWLDKKLHAVDSLILAELLPRAREGLASRGIDSADIDRYMGIIEERTRTGHTGSYWALESLATMGRAASREEPYQALTAGMIEGQASGRPVHEWALATLDGSDEWRHSYKRVAQIMTRDLFTLHPDDLVDLAASLMEWKHLRYVPVEDHSGNLVGLLTHRSLLKLLSRPSDKRMSVSVSEIMLEDPIAISPEASSLDAIELMRTEEIGCLPVTSEDKKLLGLVTEGDFFAVAAKLLDQELRKP